MMADHSVSNHTCDVLRIAEEEIVKRFPSFFPTSFKQVVSDKGNVWELTYEVPIGVLGGVPIVTIDKTTCAIIRIEHTQ